MRPVSYYQSTVTDSDTTLSATFVTIPSSTLVDRAAFLDPKGIHYHFDPDLERQSWIDDAGLTAGPMVSAETASVAIASLLRNPPHVAVAFNDIFERRNDAAQTFAEYLAFAPVVAAESSPVGAKSFGEMFTKGSGAAGASLALVAFGHTPLLFAAVPVGIILVGASMGVGDALHSGLRRVILRRMGVNADESS